VDFIAGHICERPAFIFGEALNGNASNLDDIVIEWQYWDASP
jgi:hypothetical protein